MSDSPVLKIGGAWASSGDDIYNTNAGNVGIGTNSPLSTLQIHEPVDGYTKVVSSPTGLEVWPAEVATGKSGILSATGTGAAGVLRMERTEPTSDPFIPAGAQIGRIQVLGTNPDGLGEMVQRAAIAVYSEAAWSVDAQPSSMRFFTSETDAAIERMRIAANGNVGIGTNAPEGSLHLGRKNEPRLRMTSSGNINYQGDISVGTRENIMRLQVANPINGAFDAASIDVGDTFGRDITFSTGRGDEGTYSEAMRIVANGNVGIRTASPEASLQVNRLANDNFVPSNLNPNTALLVTPGSASSTSGAVITVVGGNDAVNAVGLRMGNADNGQRAAVIYRPDQDAMTFEAGGIVERMRIAANGIVTGLWSNNSVANASSQFVTLTQAEYDALTPDANTIYFITG